MIRRLALLLLAGYTALIGAPAVDRIEPPNWWVGHQVNTIRILIHGSGLAKASLTSTTLPVTHVQYTPNGHYLFADVSIPSNTQTGDHPLLVTTADGKVQVPFRVEAPLIHLNRFEGLSNNDLLYLIMPDRFANGDTTNDDPPESPGLYSRRRMRSYHGGDFQGIINKLPYLNDLGVTCIWLTPVYDNSNEPDRLHRYGNEDTIDYHGYGPVDYYKVDEHFGDVSLLRKLVDEAHKSGIKVMLDQVLNHTGPAHPWVSDPPLPTWFNGTADQHLKNTWAVRTLADPNATAQQRKPVLEGWFADILPDLNQNEPEVRRYLIQNSLWWAGMTGVDGFRADTVPYVPRDFWRDWNSTLRESYPRLATLGEVMEYDPALVSFFEGGRKRFDNVDSGFTNLFDFPLYRTLRECLLDGLTFERLTELMEKDQLYRDPNRLVTFAGLHDVPRFMGIPNANADSLQVAFTLLFTIRGTPLIYYGDEIGLAGGDDPDNRREFPGGWRNDPHNAFQASGRTPEEERTRELVQRLAKLRAQNRVLRDGAFKVLLVTDRQLVYARELADQSMLVAINAEDRVVRLSIPVANDLVIASGFSGEIKRNKRDSVITLQPNSAIVLLPK